MRIRIRARTEHLSKYVMKALDGGAMRPHPTSQAVEEEDMLDVRQAHELVRAMRAAAPDAPDAAAAPGAGFAQFAAWCEATGARPCP